MTTVRNSFGVFDVSPELAAGIAAANARVAEIAADLGGYGARVEGRGRDGAIHAGVLVAGSTPDQGPYIRDDAGRRWSAAGAVLA